MLYEALMIEYRNLKYKEVDDMPPGLGGLYADGEIYLDKRRCRYERHGILAEEIGHHVTTYGDITDLSSFMNRKLELVARRWGYEKIVPLDKLIECHEKGHKTLEEACVYLEITPEYLEACLEHYLSRYGLYKIHNDYRVCFSPLFIIAC